MEVAEEFGNSGTGGNVRAGVDGVCVVGVGSEMSVFC